MLNLYLCSTMFIIKNNTNTKIIIQKFTSEFLNNQLYSSSKNKLSFKIYPNKKIPKISKFIVNNKIKIESNLTFLPLHFLF